MFRHSRLVFYIFSCLAVILFGCTVFHDRPLGDRNRIIIVADASVWQYVSPTLTQIFEREIQTPQPEKTFYLEQVDYGKLTDVSRRPYIMIVAPLKSGEPVSVFLSNALSPQVTDGVNRGEYYVFEKSDLWARNQLVLFVTAPDVEKLLGEIETHSSELYNLIDNHRNRAIQQEIYARLEQKNLEKQFHEKYGWRFRVQHDYIIIADDPNRHLVQIKRNYPDRWFSVHWIDGDDIYRNLDSADSVRDSLCNWFADTVFTYKEYRKYHNLEILGRPAGVLTGLWATKSDVGGGPFFTYVIYDSSLQRTFFLDGAVFAPHDVKEPFLRQLQIMADTFVPGKIP